MNLEPNAVLSKSCSLGVSENGSTERLTVYFDGSCPLCSLEIRHYASEKGSDALSFVDVSAPEASVGPGLTTDQAMKRFHVRLPNGRLVSGARAFALIWETLPRWRWASKLAKLPGAIPVLEFSYKAFLPLRGMLSRLAARVGVQAIRVKTE
ncbi:MAG: thiol-disulfide oxidoreductase DCC family protein [Hyphomicrobium sp.]